LLVLTSRDVNHPISWHPWCDVILGEVQRYFILNWNFEVSRYTERIVFCEVFKSVNWNQFTSWTSFIDELFDPCLESTSSFVLCEWELCSKIIPPFVTDRDYFELLSSHLKFDFERSAVAILLVNLSVIKVRSKLRGYGHTGHLMNDYGYNLDWLIDCLQIIIIVCFFSLICINDTPSDIKGEFDVVTYWYIYMDFTD